MTIIKIEKNSNGSHDNQTIDDVTPEELPVPEGWALVPEYLGTPKTLENYPCGDVTVEDIDGVPMVTSWTPLPKAVSDPTPEPDPEPTQLDRVEAQATYTAMMTDTLLEV